MKYLTRLLLPLLIAFNVSAEEEAPPPPLDPAYEGIHGMALMQKGSTIFASHMPLYHKPHDYQILYKVDNKDVNLLQVVRDNPLVTIKPEKFNLQRLIRGQEVVVKADVYIGHFEREGMLIYEGVPITLAEQLFVRQLTDLQEASRIQEYSAVPYNTKSGRLYVHHIQHAPSFDHIIHVDLEASCPTKFATSKVVPDEKEIQYRLINCGTMKPLYYEAQDFVKGKKH